MVVMLSPAVQYRLMKKFWTLLLFVAGRPQCPGSILGWPLEQKGWKGSLDCFYNFKSKLKRDFWKQNILLWLIRKGSCSQSPFVHSSVSPFCAAKTLLTNPHEFDPTLSANTVACLRENKTMWCNLGLPCNILHPKRKLCLEQFGNPHLQCANAFVCGFPLIEGSTRVRLVLAYRGTRSSHILWLIPKKVLCTGTGTQGSSVLL